MIVSYSGDPYLARRSARAFLREQGFGPERVTQLDEDLDADQVAHLARQSGLFGAQALFLDFDAAFAGQAGVKPRNEVMKALDGVPDDTLVVVVDSGATAARQRAFRELGDHHHVPTPRYGALARWVSQELKAVGIRHRGGVPDTLADLFGEDLPAIAAEIEKLEVLDEELDPERVREIANRPAARNAFDLIDAAVAGDARKALSVCRDLLDQGEAPPRIMGALTWQFDVVASCVALLASDPGISPDAAARTVKANPYAVKKALSVARRLDEPSLYQALDVLLAADVAMKSGQDPATAMELCTVEVAGLFAR